MSTFVSTLACAFLFLPGPLLRLLGTIASALFIGTTAENFSHFFKARILSVCGSLIHTCLDSIQQLFRFTSISASMRFNVLFVFATQSKSPATPPRGFALQSFRLAGKKNGDKRIASCRHRC
jgi:hypothetical protein